MKSQVESAEYGFSWRRRPDSNRRPPLNVGLNVLLNHIYFSGLRRRVAESMSGRLAPTRHHLFAASLSLALLSLVGCGIDGPSPKQAKACREMCAELGLHGKAYRVLFKGSLECTCSIEWGDSPPPSPEGRS